MIDAVWLAALTENTPRSIKRTYLLLLLGNTLAASLIWGINTIFLLDAGLSNLEAFAANAFFTAGMVLFEVPTGHRRRHGGRRASYLLGTVTLAVTTLLYVLLWQIEAPFWQWALVVARCSGSGSRSSPARSRRGWSTRCTRPASTGDARDGLRPRAGRRRRGDARSARSAAACSPQQINLGVPFVLRGACSS